jgi:hypothetical protein
MLKYSIGATDPVWGELMRQITRLEQLDKFPYGPEAKKDLGAALADSESLEEAREVISEFVNDARAGDKCPLARDIREVIKQRALRRNPELGAPPPFEPPPRPSGNYCKRCDGSGCIGGLAFGPARMCCPATWCDCLAARLRMTEEPDYVERVNVAREKLLRRFGPKPIASTPAKNDLHPAIDDYHGEF